MNVAHTTDDDARIEARVRAISATPPESLRNNVLAAVRKTLAANAVAVPLRPHAVSESVWNVLAGVSAVTMGLVFAPLLATPVALPQASTYREATEDVAEGLRIQDIVTERNRLLMAMAFVERPKRATSALFSRLPLEASVRRAELRAGDLRTVLEDQL